MREPFTFDQRRFLIGAAVASASGLLLGAALHPDFSSEPVLGPQILHRDGAEHLLQTVSDPGVAIYRGRIPDYVLGTDWTRPRPPQEAAVQPDVQPFVEDPGAEDQVADAADDPTAAPQMVAQADPPPDAGRAPESPDGVIETRRTWYGNPPPSADPAYPGDAASDGGDPGG